jgi:sigma-B regulation protein RsbU (phosphoserine phosphatase)
MANVQAALNVLTTMDFDLRAIIERINALLVMNTEPGTFVTMFLAVIDGRTGHVSYVNAGHNPPYLAGQRGITELTEGGVLLGVLDDPPPYRIGTALLEPGDVMFLYTDGLTEARDHTGEEFAPHRCVEALTTMHGQDASMVIRRILEQQRAFTGERPQDDDTTILAVRRTASSLP